MVMENVFNTNDISPYQENLPEEIIGFNYYNTQGHYIGTFEKGLNSYPRAVWKAVVKIKGVEVEVGYNEGLVKFIDGSYAVFKKIK